MAGHIYPASPNAYNLGHEALGKIWDNMACNEIRAATFRTRGSGGALRSPNSATKHCYLQSYDTAFQNCIDLINGRADIPRAGDITVLSGRGIYGSPTCVLGAVGCSDITMNDDTELQLGDHPTGLPVAGSAHRGELAVVHGGAGIADQQFCCLKGAGGGYSWVVVATG